MKICGACERDLPREAFSGKQWKLRKSLRRCAECVAAGNELVLFTKGRKRSEDDECPICSRLLPLQDDETLLRTCCMKIICISCHDRAGMTDDCPFCRAPRPVSYEDEFPTIQKRVNIGDPVAICHLGDCYMKGINRYERDMPKAVELVERAAALGSREAHSQLGILFDEDTDDWGIDKDMARAVEHYEIAAKQGHAFSRFNLGAIEHDTGNNGLALKHWMISAKLGDADSIDKIKDMLRWGIASKSDYAEDLRGFNDAVEEMSSSERDEARHTEEKLIARRNHHKVLATTDLPSVATKLMIESHNSRVSIGLVCDLNLVHFPPPHRGR